MWMARFVGCSRSQQFDCLEFVTSVPKFVVTIVQTLRSIPTVMVVAMMVVVADRRLRHHRNKQSL